MKTVPRLKPLCTNTLFRFFLRVNFPDVPMNNDDCDQINIDFSEYLRNRCTEKQLLNFVPGGELRVMLNQNHPLMMKGFDPAFVYHFTEFIDEQKNKIS
ncbi:hypothetical protein ES705_31435 [subsurface metagenome]